LYKYLEKENIDLYKSIELLVNRNQKDLQRLLFDKYNIKIGNKKVTRAWIKMYELYHETKFFKNLNKDTVTSFHICEAPGNFISSTLYYTKHNTNIKKYDWNAQSLNPYQNNSKTAFGDKFGFIKDNKDRWDWGKDNTGDITSHSNMMYYIERYRGVDMVVGDCGVSWDTSVTQHKDISSYQLLYSLLIPRKGGNFVMKTYASKVTPIYLSILYTVYMKYEKVYIFKSSRNRFSPEIYIVGIGFKGIDKEEERNLIKISKSLGKENILYPVSKIPTEFCIMYEYYLQKIIKSYTDMKKFFVYLVRNEDIYEEIKDDIVKSVKVKNKHWLEKYMEHL